jgi:hypothetical protein
MPDEFYRAFFYYIYMGVCEYYEFKIFKLNSRKNTAIPKLCNILIFDMKYIFLTIIFTLTCIIVKCQDSYFKVDSLTREFVPSDTLYNGKFIEGKKWTDKNGENILIVARKGPIKFKDKGMYYWRAIFTINRYIRQENGYKLYTSFSDSLIEGADIPTWLALLPNSSCVTDLDSNGIAETTHLFCHKFSSDVQPPDMKLVFNDGKKNYILLGQMFFMEGSIVNLDTFDLDKYEYNLQNVKLQKDSIGLNGNSFRRIGRYNNENDFILAPTPFIIYVRKKWAENITNYKCYNLMYFTSDDFIK